jgi:CRISPR-associated protein Csx10
MNGLPFNIELLEPLLATGLQGDPNAGISQSYVSGSVLRGAIIAVYLRDKKSKLNLSKTELNLTNRQERDLFFNDKVRFLNAYPLVNNVRSLPVPLSWQKRKDASENESDQVFDLSLAAPEENEQYKNLSTSFFAFNGPAKIIKAELKTRIAVHNRRNPIKGRAVKEDGDVFRYESIAPHIHFSGAIVSEDIELLKQLKELFLKECEILLGGSRSGGYGRARITFGDWKSDWSEPQVKGATELSAGKEFTITFLSNGLNRDENGQFQLELRLPGCEFIDTNTFRQSELIGGFNRKWGLPLPQTQSIKAGSVYRFRTERTIQKDTVSAWLEQGVGERRVDGFGRIAIDLSTAGELSFVADEPELASVTLSGDLTARMAKPIIQRLFTQKYEEELSRLTGIYQIEKQISNSQISRLRLVLRDVLRGNRPAAELDTFFSSLKKTARDQFERAKVKNYKGHLKNWVAAVVSDQLESRPFSTTPLTLGGQCFLDHSEIEDIRTRFRLRLVDNVLRRATKEARDNE